MPMLRIEPVFRWLRWGVWGERRSLSPVEVERSSTGNRSDSPRTAFASTKDGKRRVGEGTRRILRWVAAAAVVGVCAFYLVRHVDPAQVGRALAGADYRLVGLMTVGHLALLLPLKSLRWQTMLAPMQRLPLTTLYRYCLAGCAVPHLFPARAGHAARVVLVRRDGVPVTGAVGVQVLEEICNAVVLGLLCTPLPFLLPLPLPRSVRLTLALVTLGAAIGVALSV